MFKLRTRTKYCQNMTKCLKWSDCLWNGTKINRLSCIQVIFISYQTYHYTHIYICIYKAVSILVKPSRVRPASTNRRSGLSGLSMFGSSFKCWTQEIAYEICINHVLYMLVNASYRYLCRVVISV